MNYAKQLVAKKASRLKGHDEYNHELKKVEAMLAVDLERGGVEGGFFPQVGTNLSTPDSVSKTTSGVKKSAEKSEKLEQTTPILDLRRGVTLPSKAKTPPSGSSVVDILKKVSPKRLTVEAEARFGNRFKDYARNVQRDVQRGAAALGLSEPTQTKRKLLNTPGGTPGLPA